LIGAAFAEGYGFGNGRRRGLFPNLLDSCEDFPDFGLPFGRQGDSFAAALFGIVYNAGSFDAFLAFEVVEIIEELEESGAPPACALLDLIHHAIFGKVEPDQSVHEDVFAALFGKALLMEQLSKRDILRSDASGDVFLLEAMRVPPEFAGTQDIVMHLSAPDMQFR
jgi:hypothetical protein